jgi:hypothetical protein
MHADDCGRESPVHKSGLSEAAGMRRRSKSGAASRVVLRIVLAHGVSQPAETITIVTRFGGCPASAFGKVRREKEPPNMDELFFQANSRTIAAFIRTAQQSVCYAAPGIQIGPAEALQEVARRLGPEMVSVCVEFDERTIRMGYGSIEAVAGLRDADIVVSTSKGFRAALVIVDGSGFMFTPTARYLEAEPTGDGSPNALRLTDQQVAEALARLSPAAKAMAVARARTGEERARIDALPVEVQAEPVSVEAFREVSDALKAAPPVAFDVVRQVRVYEPYLQYVEMRLSGAALQRHRLKIPPWIQALGGGDELQGRLKTTFDLIESGGRLSSKALEDALRKIRDTFTPSLGKKLDRVVLKSKKPLLQERLQSFKQKLEAHQALVRVELQPKLDESRMQIVDYFLPRIVASPPDALTAQLLSNNVSEAEARRWLDKELDDVFPSAADLVKKMELEVDYKDVTYETLSKPDFLDAVKVAFPQINWERAHEEYLAAKSQSN